MPSRCGKAVDAANMRDNVYVKTFGFPLNAIEITRAVQIRYDRYEEEVSVENRASSLLALCGRPWLSLHSVHGLVIACKNERHAV